MKNTAKKLLALLLALVLTVVPTACGKQTAAGTDGQTGASAVEKAALPVADGAVIGQGATSVAVEVTGADGRTIAFTVNTDEETVGAALLSLGVIAGDSSEYGLYVKTVNGETADYDRDGAYWAFYIDGEYASVGVDYTAPEAGRTYAFRVEKAA